MSNKKSMKQCRRKKASAAFSLRNREIKVRLTEDEFKELKTAVLQSGLSRESYIRMLINGYEPQIRPSVEYHEMITQLRRIGTNLNQLAMIAHKTGGIDILRYKKDIENLDNSILEIREAVCLPRKK